MVTQSGMSGIVWNGNNTLYICYWNKIKYSLETGKLDTLAGNEYSGYQDGNIKDATFVCPQGIAMDRNGDLYVTDSDRIRKISIRLRIVQTIAGPTDRTKSFGHQDGEAKNAKFFSPAGIVVRDDGTVYVCNRNCIRQIKNGVVSTIAGTPQHSGYKDGPAHQSQFSKLRGLTMLDDAFLSLMGSMD